MDPELMPVHTVMPTEAVTSQLRTRKRWTWFARIAFTVFLAFVIYTVVLIAAGSTNDLSVPDVYFGVTFGLAVLIFFVPLKQEPEDSSDERPHIHQKSYCWWWEKLSTFVLLLFVTFSSASLIVVQVGGVDPVTDKSYVLTIAFTAALFIAIPAILLSKLTSLAQGFTFWVFTAIWFLGSIPQPSKSEVVFGIFGFGIVLIIIYVISLISRQIIQDLHVCALDGVAIMFSSYFLFDSYVYWIGRSFTDYRYIGVGVGSITLGRYLYYLVFTRFQKQVTKKGSLWTTGAWFSRRSTGPVPRKPENEDDDEESLTSNHGDEDRREEEEDQEDDDEETQTELSD